MLSDVLTSRFGITPLLSFKPDYVLIFRHDIKKKKTYFLTPRLSYPSLRLSKRSLLCQHALL